MEIPAPSEHPEKVEFPAIEWVEGAGSHRQQPLNAEARKGNAEARRGKQHHNNNDRGTTAQSRWPMFRKTFAFLRAASALSAIKMS